MPGDTRCLNQINSKKNIWRALPKMTLKEESLTRFLHVNKLLSQGENGKVRHRRSEQTDAGEQNRC